MKNIFKFLTLMLLALVWTVRIYESRDGKFYWTAKLSDERGNMKRVVDFPMNYTSEEKAVKGWEDYAAEEGIEEWTLISVKPAN